MRWAIAIFLGGIFYLASAHDAAAGMQEPFDIGACTLDRTAPAAVVSTLADLPRERGGPPRASTQLLRIDARTRAANTARIAATIPTSWKPHLELDMFAMATKLEIHLPGEYTAAELAPAVLDFVRTHPCLFGIVDPSAVDVRVLGLHHEGTVAMVDVKPRALGTMWVSIDVEHGATRVQFVHHLWPVKEPSATIDAHQILARFVGKTATLHVGSRYLIYPKTHRHRGCAPIVRTQVTVVASFAVRPGPILVCADDVADVRAGAFVWLRGQTRDGDPMLRELPTALAPNGHSFGRPWIAPAIRTPDDDALGSDAGGCGP
jgi:hypothetical protein